MQLGLNHLGLNGVGGNLNPVLDLLFTSDSTVDSRITYSGGAGGTYIDSLGSMRLQRGNLLLYSGDPTNAAWTKTGMTAVAQSDGSYKLVESALSENHYMMQSTAVIVNQPRIVMFRVKAGERSWVAIENGIHVAYFNLSTGTVGSVTAGTARINAVTDLPGWYDCTFALASSSDSRAFLFLASGDGVTNYQGDGTSGIYFRRAQQEPGTSFTSYIATTSAAVYAPRIDFDPTTLAARGVLIEEQRTNSIRNSTMQGAASGTPGTMPTNWTLVFNGVTGLTGTVTAGNTENGMSVLDLRVNGTPSATVASGIQIAMEATNSISASAGQVWTASVYAKLIAGTFTNVGQAQFNLQTYTSVPAFIQSNTSNVTVATSGNLSVNRISSTITLVGASTAFTRPLLQFGTTSGQAIDFTIRIALPQVELGAFATSTIPTTNAAVTRTADTATMTGTNFSWFNGAQGMIVLERTSLKANPGTPTGYQAVQADDGTNNNRIIIAVDTNTGSAYGQFVTFAGGASTQGTGGTAVTGVPYKIGIAYSSSGFSVSKDGGAIASVSTTLPTGLTTLRISSDVTGNSNNGWIRRIRAWRTRLPDASLQAITQ